MVQYIIFDTESVPDGRLIKLVKYRDEDISEEEAIEKAKKQALESSGGKTDFLPPVFQFPVALCLLKIEQDLSINELVLLDEPHFRSFEIVKDFWKGLNHYKVPIISYNGRGFDLPLMEVAAFRYGLSVPYHFSSRNSTRYRFSDKHIDLMDWITNYGACRQGYSLDLFSKLLGKPGKMATKGSDVYEMFLRGEIREINEYCAYDVFDTYFIFLRHLVLLGKITIEMEKSIVQLAKKWITENSLKHPFLKEYLANWGDWSPWL